MRCRLSATLALVLALFSLVAFGTAALAQDGGLAVPGDPAVAQPAAVVLAVEGNTITASADGAVLWQRSVRDSGDGETVVGGFEHAGFAWFAMRADVYIADLRSGVVLRRERLTGAVSSLQVDDTGRVVATYGDTSERPEWQREVVVAREHDAWLPPGRAAEVIRYRTDAEYFAAELLDVDNTDNEIDELLAAPPAAGTAARALAELGVAEQLDPTNPWYSFWAARIAHAVGDEAGARAALRRAIDIDPAYAMELIPMAERIDAIDPELGDEAFAKGLRAAGLRGYVPPVASSLIGVIVWLGRPEEGNTSTAYLERRAARLWQLAPFTEGAAYFYNAVADRLADEGRATDAALWRSRAVAAAPWRMFGGPAPSAANTGIALNLMIAGIGAFLLGFFVRLVWRLSSGVRGAQTRWQAVLITRAWSRLELLGLIGVFVVATAAGMYCTRGVATIGRMASAALPVATGFPGHPAAALYWESLPPNDGTRFVQAYSLHHAGELDAAEQLYLAINAPEALNNRGVIAAQRGNPNAAQELYTQALAADPALEAAVRNTGGTLTVGADRPTLLAPRNGFWIAPPSEALLGSAWESGIGSKDPRAALQLFSQLDPRADGGFNPFAPALLAQVPGLLAVLFVVLGLFGSRVEKWAPGSPTSVLGWLLSFVVPGTSRIYSVLGPFVTAATLFWLLLYSSWRASDGQALSILDAIALPSLAQYFGIAGSDPTPLVATLGRLAPFWWVPLVVNLVLVALAEMVAPDDDGPVAWRRDNRVRR